MASNRTLYAICVKHRGRQERKQRTWKKFNTLRTSIPSYPLKINSCKQLIVTALAIYSFLPLFSPQYSFGLLFYSSEPQKNYNFFIHSSAHRKSTLRPYAWNPKRRNIFHSWRHLAGSEQQRAEVLSIWLVLVWSVASTMTRT